MEIRTKFKPGDPVWYMKNNKPLRMSIDRIRIFSGYEDGVLYVRVQYTFDSFDAVNEKFYDESDLFATKEELKESIFG